MEIKKYCNDNLADLTYLMNQWFENIQFDNERISRNINDIDKNSSNNIFVAVDETGRAVGYIYTGISYFIGFDPFVEVISLLVDKENRSKGIGRKLIEFVIEYYKEQGIDEIRLSSGIERERAHSFYKNLGFKEYKQSKFFVKNI